MRATLTPPARTPVPPRPETTVRMGGDALPRWWKIGANLLVVLLAVVALYEVALRTSLEWETSRGDLAREALWSFAETYRAFVAPLPAVLLACGVLLVLRLPRGWARREIVVDSRGLEVVKHRRWWFAGRRGRIPWSDVQVVSAWRALFWERPGPGGRRVMRPVLDIYLRGGDVDLPDWVACTTVTEAPLDGIELPATRVRIGGPGTSTEQSLRELAGAMGRARPDLFYRGRDAEQWYTPPSNRRLVDVVVTGDDKDTLPMERTAPPRPIWLCFTMPVTRWVVGLVFLVALTAGAGYGLFTPWWQPWATAVAAATLLVLLPLVVSWVAFAPRKLARQGMGVDAEGIYVLQEPMWWLPSRVWFGVGWDQVLATVARMAPAAGALGRGRPAYVLDIYVSGPVPARLGNRILVTRHEQPDGPGMADLAAFPATRLRLYYSPTRERRGLRWGRGWRRRSAVRKLSRHQLRPALLSVQPELCHGFEDVDLDLAARPRRPAWLRRRSATPPA